MRKSAFYLLLGTVALFFLQSLSRPRRADTRPHPLITASSDESFDVDVMEASEWVLLDFWAPWCGTCMRLKPELNELAPLYENQVTFLSLNIDETLRTKDRFSIFGVPTLVLLRNGHEVGRWTGPARRSVLQDWLDGFLQRG